jgi:hypothetical protein
MIGMDFVSFLILLVISVVVSGILHYGLNYYVTPGFWSFCSKVVIGWVDTVISTNTGTWVVTAPPIIAAPISPTPITVVLDSLAIAASAAGTTSPSTVMNVTALPTLSSLPGNPMPFGGNTVLPYGNDTGAVGGSTTNQQTSSTSGTNQQTATTGTTNRQGSNTSVRKRRQGSENGRNGASRTVRKPAPECAPSVQGAL